MLKLDDITPYVVSIERSRSKKIKSYNKLNERIKSIFDKEPQIVGVDGECLSKDQITNHMSNKIKRKLRNGEVGLCLSTMEIYDQMIKNNIKAAIIFEDDAVIKFEDDIFKKKLKLLLEKTPKDFYVLSLFKHKWQIDKFKYKPYNILLHKISRHCFGTVGYIITLQGAKVIRQKMYPFSRPIDFFLFNTCDNFNKGYLSKEPLIDVCSYINSTTM